VADGGDGGLLVVARELGGLDSELLEDVVDEGVHGGHGIGGDADVGVHLLQHLEDVDFYVSTLFFGRFFPFLSPPSSLPVGSHFLAFGFYPAGAGPSLSPAPPPRASSPPASSPPWAPWMPLGFGAVGRDAVAGSLDRRSAGGNESRFDGWVLNLQRFRIYLILRTLVGNCFRKSSQTHCE
jgi:hypothetical protein